jgi:hypothetical protein
MNLHFDAILLPDLEIHALTVDRRVPLVELSKGDAIIRRNLAAVIARFDDVLFLAIAGPRVRFGLRSRTAAAGDRRLIVFVVAVGLDAVIVVAFIVVVASALRITVIIIIAAFRVTVILIVVAAFRVAVVIVISWRGRRLWRIVAVFLVVLVVISLSEGSIAATVSRNFRNESLIVVEINATLLRRESITDVIVECTTTSEASGDRQAHGCWCRRSEGRKTSKDQHRLGQHRVSDRGVQIRKEIKAKKG